jgi:flavin-dependent thymidylate synthase
MIEHNHPGEFLFIEGCPGCSPGEPPLSTILNEDDSDHPSRQYGSEVARWADDAMYAAAPLVREGEEVEPTVTILAMTPKPLQVMAAVNQIYKGDPVHSPDDVPRPMALAFIEDMKKTTLKAPLEWCHLALFIEGVSRAFTHQLVRQRMATFAQESLRFAVKENAGMEVVIPPAFAILPADDETRREWDDHMARTGWLYNRWIDKGIPAEDARGGLLINTATRIHYDTNLRSLADHSGYRLCSQAQYEWKIVWAKIVGAITEYGPEEDRWQQRAIATLFKPICFQTGKCEFMGTADRYCVIRDRVEAHHEAGDPPETWTDIGVWEPLGYSAARKS